MTLGLALIGYTFYTGIGVWGNNSPVFWAFDIINFVFWVGIGHAGTLISAILFLFRKRWRNAIARFAEAMTIFAVMCAGIFPLIHVGRPWLAFWLFPYPNQRALWTNFRSPLLWDVFAVSTYFSRVGHVLVPRPRARHRLHARPDQEQILKPIYTVLSASAGAAPPRTGSTTRRPTCSWRASPRAWSSRCTAWSPSTSPSPSCPAGT